MGQVLFVAYCMWTVLSMLLEMLHLRVVSLLYPFRSIPHFKVF